jgi:WD40 repeat protein
MVVKNYGKIHANIESIVISSDDKYLFTSDCEDNGHVKQFLVRNGQMTKDHGVIFEDNAIRSMITTPDNNYLFTGSFSGHLKQISLKSQQEVHDYGKIHCSEISCLQTTRDSKWLITGSWDFHVKRISVENREVDKDFGQVCDFRIGSMKITAYGGLLVGDGEGHLKLISSTDGRVIKDFGHVHDNWISGIVTTADQKFFFTSSFWGVLKQWNHEDNTLVRDHGKIKNSIYSLC